MDYEIKVINLSGGRPKTVHMSRGEAVGDAIREAGMSADGMTIRYNSTECSTSTTLTASGQITISKTQKGN